MLTPFLCHCTVAAGLASVTSQVSLISFPVRISNTSGRGERAPDVTVMDTGFTAAGRGRGLLLTSQREGQASQGGRGSAGGAVDGF